MVPLHPFRPRLLDSLRDYSRRQRKQITGFRERVMPDSVMTAIR